MTEFEQNLIPLAEYLGIPLIILTPLAVILYIIFKFVIPKLMNNNSRLTGQIVMGIVAGLFGEAGEDSILKGVEELDVSKVIKNLPKIVNDSLDNNNKYLMDTIELFVMLSQALMDERFIKPNNDAILQNVVKKGKVLIENIDKDRKRNKGSEVNGETKENKV